MNKEQLCLQDQIDKFNKGDFDSNDIKTQISAGWYDWFCRDSAIANKTKNLYIKTKRILKADNGKRINIKTMYICFKNNCPGNGSLYDDFRIANISTGDVIYTIVPRSGHKVHNNRAELWGKENNFKEPIIFGSWKDIVKWFSFIE